MSMNTNQVLQDVTVEMTAEQEAYRKAEKRRFVIAVVIAILGTLTAFSESGDGNASLVGMMIGTPMAFVLFGGIPYGWNLVSKVTRYFEWILFLPIMGWLIYFGVKLMASMCCGWFFFGRECLVRLQTVVGGRRCNYGGIVVLCEFFKIIYSDQL